MEMKEAQSRKEDMKQKLGITRDKDATKSEKAYFDNNLGVEKGDPIKEKVDEKILDEKEILKNKLKGFFVNEAETNSRETPSQTPETPVAPPKAVDPTKKSNLLKDYLINKKKME